MAETRLPQHGSNWPSTAVGGAVIISSVCLLYGVVRFPDSVRGDGARSFILGGPFAASGMTDAETFVAQHLMSAASSHLVIAPVIAAAIGGLSAIMYFFVSPMSRRVAVGGLLSVVALLFAGTASIAYASSL